MDALFVLAGRRRQHEAARTGVDDNRHAVALGEHVGEHAHRCAHERQLVGGIIEPETSIRKTRFRGEGSRSLSSRPCSPISASRWRGFHGHGVSSVVIENGSFARWLWIVEAEIVDELFDADGAGGRQLPSVMNRRTLA